MNKKTVIAVLSASALLFAEAYQVNTLSTKQLGMGHTGAGQSTIGVEGMHFNPGGLGLMENKIDASAGATFITPRVEINETTAEKGVSTPLYLYAGANVRKWSFGMSVTTPYGNSAQWDKNWEGAELIQDISLKVITFQPTVAFNLLNIVGIGGGVTINTGSFSQSKALVGPGKFTVPPYNELSVASINLEGDADTKVGFNVGAMVKVTPFLSAGVGYRSEVKAKVSDGKAKVEYAENFPDDYKPNLLMPNPLGQYGATVAIFDGTKFEAQLPLPANLNVGVSFTPKENLLFNFDVQWINWEAYDTLTLTFRNVDVTQNLKMDLVNPYPKKYENSMAFRLGSQIGLKENFDLRFGAYFDQTPVPDEYLNPETPSTNKLGLTTGCSFRPIPLLSIDAAVLYVRCLGEREIKDNNINGFYGKYNVQAIAPSIGVSFKF